MHLSYIDAGLESIEEVSSSFPPFLQSLNMHCNRLTEITGLNSFCHLTHLDLSANQITIMKNLDCLLGLQVLNLACNLIEVVEGLKSLRQLSYLNLSYNKVKDVSGLALLHGHRYKLSMLRLHGNNLQSVSDMVKSLQGIISLHNLVLQYDGAKNPVCEIPEYRQKLLQSLPQLTSLDRMDRAGTLVPDSMSMQIQCGIVLDEKTDDSPPAIRSNLTLGAKETTESLHGDVHNANYNSCMNRHAEERIAKLESQLASLLSARMLPESYARSSLPVCLEKQENSFTNTSVPCTMFTSSQMDLVSNDRSCSLIGSTTDATHVSAVCRDATPNSTNKLSSASDTSLTETPVKLGNPDKCTAPPLPAKRNKSHSSKKISMKSASHDKKEIIVRRRSDPERLADKVPVLLKAEKDISQDYHAERETSLYLQEMIKEMELEREKRWKAEEENRILAKNMQSFEQKAYEDMALQDAAIEATSRLKEAINREREARMNLQKEIDRVKLQLEDTQRKLSLSKESEAKQKESVHKMEEVISQLESEHAGRQADMAKKYQESQMKAAACSKEIDLLKCTIKSLKQQIQQLQELLSTREQKHKEEMEGMYKPSSSEIQSLVEKQLEQFRELQQHKDKVNQEKIESLYKEYARLEDEFKNAVQAEVRRYDMLKENLKKAVEEVDHYKHLYTVQSAKEEQSAKLIMELTSVVKDQKTRITDQFCCQDKANSHYQETICNLEVKLEKMVEVQHRAQDLSEENLKLQSQLAARDSYVDSFKAEKDLWTRELVQQGASLARDRAALELNIQGLTDEVTALSAKLSEQKDAVKIKSKIVDDQNETIRDLKKKISEKDELIQTYQTNDGEKAKELEHQLAEQVHRNQQLQDECNQLLERKAELKQQVQDSQTELEEFKKSLTSLTACWSEKSETMKKLESQVVEMKTNWKTKEKNLIQERDKAIKAAELAIEKLRAADLKFQEQCHALDRNYFDEIALVRKDAERKIQEAKLKVMQLEKEKRSILEEAEAHKKQLEVKLKNFSSAFTALQNGLSL